MSSIFAHLPQLCVLHQQLRLPCVNGGMAPPDELALEGARKDETPVQLELGPLPHLAHCLLTVWVRSVLIGTSASATEHACGFGATAYAPGVVAVAIAATTASLSAAAASRPR